MYRPDALSALGGWESLDDCVEAMEKRRLPTMPDLDEEEDAESL